MKTCGEFGGVTRKGAPCLQPVKDGRCWRHEEGAVPDNMQRQKKARQNAFLAAFSRTGNITVAANKAGINRGTHYEWIDTDPEYAGRFADASEEAADYLEAEARRRAVVGVEEPVGWYQGEAGGTVRKYSDTLLIFLLKGLRPEKFRERYSHEHSGEIDTGGDVHIYLPDNRRDDVPESVRDRMSTAGGNGAHD